MPGSISENRFVKALTAALLFLTGFPQPIENVFRSLKITN
jgi:hypothetical protein